MFIKQESSTITEQSLAQFIADKFSTGVNIEASDKGYTLWWTDFVANEWFENYDHLSTLLLRLAILVHCGEKDWEIGFVENDPRAVEIMASRFLASQTN